MKRLIRTLVVAAVLTVPVSAFAGAGINGIKFNGVKVNGVKFNGVKYNGVRFNGPEAPEPLVLKDVRAERGRLTR